MLSKILNRKNISYADFAIAIITLIIGLFLTIKGFHYFAEHNVSPYTSWLYQHKDKPIKAITAFAMSLDTVKAFAIALLTDIVGIIFMLIGVVFLLTGAEGAWASLYKIKNNK